MPYWIYWLATTYNDGLNVHKTDFLVQKTMFGFKIKYIHNPNKLLLTV